MALRLFAHLHVLFVTPICVGNGHPIHPCMCANLCEFLIHLHIFHS